MNGVELIAAERQRQIEDEGYTSEHDDKHTRHELAIAAAIYAAPGAWQGFHVDERPRNRILPFWPWAGADYKSGPNRIQELVKAGALIAAEIDRLQRLQSSTDCQP